MQRSKALTQRRYDRFLKDKFNDFRVILFFHGSHFNFHESSRS